MTARARRAGAKRFLSGTRFEPPAACPVPKPNGTWGIYIVDIYPPGCPAIGTFHLSRHPGICPVNHPVSCPVSF